MDTKPRLIAASMVMTKRDWACLNTGHEMTIIQDVPDLEGGFSRNVVAVVWGDDDAEERATAQLLASAPDLLRDLKEAVELLERSNTGSFDRAGGWQCSTEELVGDFRATISRAEGKS